MRHLKLRLKIIWLLLTNQYTNSDKEKKWHLWGFPDRDVFIGFPEAPETEEETEYETREFPKDRFQHQPKQDIHERSEK